MFIFLISEAAVIECANAAEWEEQGYRINVTPTAVRCLCLCGVFGTFVINQTKSPF